MRARITPAEAARLEHVLLREDRILQGRFMEATDAGLLLEVPSVTVTTGTSTERLNQRITLAPADIVELELRELDRWRTAGVAAILAGAATYALVVAFSDSEKPAPGGEKPGSEQILLPIFRLVW